MMCPHCGKEIYAEDKQAYSKMLSAEIERRLIGYGYPEKRRPDKYQATVAFRKTIATSMMRHEGILRMTEVEYERAIAILDLVLPARKAGAENG